LPLVIRLSSEPFQRIFCFYSVLKSVNNTKPSRLKSQQHVVAGCNFLWPWERLPASNILLQQCFELCMLLHLICTLLWAYSPHNQIVIMVSGANNTCHRLTVTYLCLYCP
jgi:hypothetical protein